MEQLRSARKVGSGGSNHSSNVSAFFDTSSGGPEICCSNGVPEIRRLGRGGGLAAGTADTTIQFDTLGVRTAGSVWRRLKSVRAEVRTPGSVWRRLKSVRAGARGRGEIGCWRRASLRAKIQTALENCAREAPFLQPFPKSSAMNDAFATERPAPPRPRVNTFHFHDFRRPKLRADTALDARRAARSPVDRQTLQSVNASFSDTIGSRTGMNSCPTKPVYPSSASVVMIRG